MEVTLEGESIKNSFKRDSKRRTELLQSKSLKGWSLRPSLKELPEGPRCGASTVTVNRLLDFMNLERTMILGPFHPPEGEEDVVGPPVHRGGHPVSREPGHGHPGLCRAPRGRCNLALTERWACSLFSRASCPSSCFSNMVSTLG